MRKITIKENLYVFGSLLLIILFFIIGFFIHSDTISTWNKIIIGIPIIFLWILLYVKVIRNSPTSGRY